jgi:uncharacterized protein involved in response to NO
MMGHVFSFAFRPLFFLAIVYGIISVCWWGFAWSGYLPMPGSGGNPILWHGHEMIFGFAAAAIAGFALTAVANWTKRPPVSGLPLIALCSCWLSARVLALAGSESLLIPTATADLAFDVLLCALMAREVVAGNSRRNYKLIALLALFTVANAAFYIGQSLQAEWTQRALWAGLWLVVLTVNVIGGRVIPAFTGNWLMMQARSKQQAEPKRPPPFGRQDQVASASTLVFAALFLWDNNSGVTALVGFIAAATQLLRWSRWQFYRTLHDPIVWVLHIGFLWIPVGIALLSGSAMNWLPVSSGIHALMTGAATTMILAVASRAALGHSNRPLANNPLVTASYVGITITTVLRIIASISDNPLWMTLATLAWVISLGLFAWRYTPILLGPPAKQAV